MVENILNTNNLDDVSVLFGDIDKNIELIQSHYNVKILSRGSDIKIIGDDCNVEKTSIVIKSLLRMIKDRQEITDVSIRYVISMVDNGSHAKLDELSGDGICLTARGKIIRAKTLGQKKYVRAIADNTIVLGVGPAGTGKTYLAVAMAVKAFKANEISRIILTRPAVEAGEKLGFLPGDLQDKVDPYLRPLYDGLFDMIGNEAFQRLLEKGIIEVAPLAYMRGRTLDNAFIILDEAQNTTSEQIKMFLTRLGFNSKMVITGDVTQIDLPDKRSGLVEAMKILKDVRDISVVEFTDVDVVRHSLVQDIIRAYDKYKSVGEKINE